MRANSAAQLQILWVAGGAIGGAGRGGAAPRRQAGANDDTARSDRGGDPGGGETFEGRLERIDDFMVFLTQPTARRDRFAAPTTSRKSRSAIRFEAHRNMLPVYTDKDIHDVTAYLAGVK